MTFPHIPFNFTVPSIVSWLEIVVSIVLVVLVAIQQKGSSLGSAFGGSGEVYSTRRGAQKNIYYATVAFATLFLVLGILSVVLPA